MKKTLNPVFLMLLCCFAANLEAQNNYQVLLRSGKTLFPENTKDYASTATIGAEEMIEDHYYRMVQFYDIPNKAKLNAITQQGIQLLEYIPNKTYIASIPLGFDLDKLEALQVRSVQLITRDMKMAEALKNMDLPDWAVQKNKVLAMLKFYKDLKHETALRYCEADGIKVLQENGYNNFLKVAIPLDQIAKVASLPYVAFVELIPAPGVPDDHLGRSLHRSNALDAEFGTGKHYNGEGVNMLVRDDGIVGPHIDFQGRIDNSNTISQFGTHGDGVAGIMAGAANLDPKQKGMASAAGLFIVDYEPEFLDETMDLFFNNNVIVTNSSYSNGCNDGYTEITETIDQQLYNNPTLMHVFSAGNSNGSDCGYGAGSEWGNITGGHKQAKNCLTTANLNAEAVLNSSSSRGPAHDGRIKPDIAAYGTPQVSTDEFNSYQDFGGTSAASPGIAGVMAQLHHAYRDLNQGETAPAALLKACLLNTANDLGNPGPDFKFGWGHVNAYRAAKVLEEQRYLKQSIDQGESKIHSIPVPDNVMQLRVMVYWAEPEATVFTTKALVNNLDASIQTPGNIFYPWILDPTPNPSLLNTNATKGVDDLNNMEQITIDNPEAGNYDLFVQATELPFGTHEYYVIWEYRTMEVALTHPYGGESFSPGEAIRIHWDAEGDAGQFEIAYSADGGGTFNSIGTVDGTVRMFDFLPPNQVTAKGIIKVTRGSNSGQSVEPFSIAPKPNSVNVVQACPDFLKVIWNPVNFGSASANTIYEVFLLGDKYMEPIGTTTNTSYNVPTINQDPTAEHWIAVRALGDDGLKSERTIAVNYNGGLMNCAQDNDMSLLSIESPSAGSISGCGSSELPVKVKLFNAGLLPQSNIVVSYQFGSNPPVVEVIPGPMEAGDVLDYTFSQGLTIAGNGSYNLMASANIDNDAVAFNNSVSQTMNIALYPGTGEPLDYSEGFESAIFPPAYYSIVNSDGAYSWEQANVIGSQGDITNALFVNNYDYSTSGEEDEILTVPINLEGVAEAFLSFDVAYAYYNDTWQDGLRVEIYENCGASFTGVLYYKFGPALATVGALSDFFEPEGPNDWRNESIDLTDYTGTAIVLKFININGYGNSLYVDNININSSSVVAPVAAFISTDNEICEGETVTFTSNSTGTNLSYAWDFGQNASPSNSSDQGPISVTFNESGTYNVEMTVSNSVGESSEQMAITVNSSPLAGYTYIVNDASVSFTNTSQFGSSYEWDFGDGITSSATNPTHTYTEPGSYEVTLSASNDCGVSAFSFEVEVAFTNVTEPGQQLQAMVYPNPNLGLFNLIITNNKIEELSAQLLDVRGVVLTAKKLTTTSGTSSWEFSESNLPPGLYFIKINGENGVKVLKIVVE